MTFEELKKSADECVSQGGEPEICITFSDKEAEYMIIAFKEKCSFQRCGSHNGSGGFFYGSLDGLYEAETVDGIILKRDWDKITEIWSDDFEL